MMGNIDKNKEQRDVNTEDVRKGHRDYLNLNFIKILHTGISICKMEWLYTLDRNTYKEK